jgi:hypothetical protein
MDKTQYSVSSQMPTSAEVVNSGYEPLTNSYSGLPMARFANGGGVKEKDIDLRYSAMPQGSQEYDPRFMPLQVDNRPITGPQAALLRLQIEKQLGKEARLRAAAMGNVMALPGQTGLRGMPGAFEVGYNTPAGIGNLDISAMRAMRGTPDGKTPYGVNARYSIPFAKGGLASFSEGGTPEEQQATIADLYKKLLGRDPGEGEDIMQWKDYLGEGSPSEVLSLADRLAQTEEGTAYGKSEGNKVFSNMVELTQKDSPFAGTENAYSNMKFLGGTQDPEGNPLYRFQDQNSGLMTVDASGQPIKYEPGRGWYDEQLRSKPDALRGTDYRNQSYLSTGPLDQTYKFNGIDVPISAEEYQVDPKTGQFVTGKTGEYRPVEWRPRGYDMWADWAGPAAVLAFPALAAAATYAAPYLAGAGAAGTGAGGAFTTAELLAGAGGAFVPTAGSGASFLLPTGAAAAGAAGAGAGGAATQGLTLKNAYDAYKYGKMGLNVLNALSGGQQPSGLNSAPNATGYSAFDPGVRTVGLPIGSGYEKTPWANMMPQISLSKLSEFAPTRELAAGGMTGIGHLGGYSDGGRLLKGPGDGMSDNIPASIADKQPARLADGEFVVPADVVSHLGNGSTDAGAKQLYLMMDKIRKARTGNEKQGKQINPNKFLPKG